MHDRLAAALSDRYDVERELGRGGMATVWLASDRRHERRVAIKVLHPELAGAIGADRFVREVRLTARVQHPSVVPVLDSGVLPADGDIPLPWYAMAYVPGTSLRARLTREEQLPVDEAIAITREVAGALSAAHAQGIVHRDIKPENILLADGRVYVVDFGIAKALLATDEHLTSTGLALGTPAYMSPEQATGAPVDARTDQYSLAAVLYEMLAGEPPATGPNAQAIIARRLAEPARPIRPVRSTVSEELERAILRALERVPADRFADVAAFSAALQTASGSNATSATSATSATAIPSNVAATRRLRLALVAAAAGVVAVVALAAWSAVVRRGVPAVAARKAQRDTLYRRGLRGYEQRTTAGLLDGIQSFKAAVALDSAFASGWAGLAKAYVRVVERQYQIPGVEPDSLRRLAVSALDRAIALDTTDAEVWVGKAAVIRTVDPTDVTVSMRAARRAIALDSVNAQAWHFLAVGLAEQGMLDSALTVWREEVRRRPDYTFGLMFLAQGLFWHRQYDSAAVWADSALALDPSYVTARDLAGQVEAERGNFARAIAAYQAAGRLGTDVDAANALSGRALVAARMGQRREARATLQAADSMARRFAPAPLHTAVSVARAYAALGDVTGAVAWLRRYPSQQDLHFQLHVRCDGPFTAIANDPRFREILAAGPDGAGC
jgi:tRNA A-37 threonylcarbamoyl transferase component Bud32/tetratricopeptide (TPR) repeat protein